MLKELMLKLMLQRPALKCNWHHERAWDSWQTGLVINCFQVEIVRFSQQNLWLQESFVDQASFLVQASATGWKDTPKRVS